MGLEHLHSMDIPHGDLKGVGSPPDYPGENSHANPALTGKRHHRPEGTCSSDGIRAGAHQPSPEFHRRCHFGIRWDLQMAGPGNHYSRSKGGRHTGRGV